MFDFLKKVGKNKQLDEVVQCIQMNFTHKDQKPTWV